MKRLQRRWVVGVVLVFIVAISMWFAAPTIAAVTQNAGVSANVGANGVYQEHGIIVIEKRDKSTGNIINAPGVVFNISPDPYTRAIGSSLAVVDNTVVNADYDINPANGIIRLQNVITGSYSIVEVFPPAGYQVDPTVYPINVTTGQITTFVSRDDPASRIPASSNITLWIMIGIFGTLICGFMVWRNRRAHVS